MMSEQPVLATPGIERLASQRVAFLQRKQLLFRTPVLGVLLCRRQSLVLAHRSSFHPVF